MKIFGQGKARRQRAADEAARVAELEADLVRIKRDLAAAEAQGQHDRVAVLERKLDLANEQLVMTLDLRGFDLL